jgi:hypothetical protein
LIVRPQIAAVRVPERLHLLLDALVSPRILGSGSDEVDVEAVSQISHPNGPGGIPLAIGANHDRSRRGAKRLDLIAPRHDKTGLLIERPDDGGRELNGPVEGGMIASG